MHYNIWRIINNPVLFPTLTAWFSAQLIKTVTHFIRTRRWGWGWFLTAGGMPSSHSSMVMAVTVTTGLTLGFDSILFGVTLALALIVMYDAAGVRRESGNQAKAINSLVEQFFSDHELDFDRLKELIGHEPIEVLAGALLGTVIAILFSFR
jgi:acid phosphatase family membrane protein YuiD